MSTHVAYLESLDACNDAIEWAKGFLSLKDMGHE